MRRMRCADEAQRQDQVRRPEMEVQGLRGVLHASHRQLGKAAQGVPQVAHGQADDRGGGLLLEGDLRAPHGEVLEALAAFLVHGRGP